MACCSSLPAHTPEPVQPGVKREPSSLVQSATTRSRSRQTPASRRACTTSTPATTPSMPSKRPPSGCESPCEPAITGGRLLSLPGSTPKMLPMASTCISQSNSASHVQSCWRAPLSASERASRVTPPPAVAPKAEIASMRLCSRALSTRTLFMRSPFISALRSRGGAACHRTPPGHLPSRAGFPMTCQTCRGTACRCVPCPIRPRCGACG